MKAVNSEYKKVFGREMSIVATIVQGIDNWQKIVGASVSCDYSIFCHRY